MTHGLVNQCISLKDYRKLDSKVERRLLMWCWGNGTYISPFRPSFEMPCWFSAKAHKAVLSSWNTHPIPSGRELELGYPKCNKSRRKKTFRVTLGVRRRVDFTLSSVNYLRDITKPSGIEILKKEIVILSELSAFLSWKVQKPLHLGV